jgi:hypothetical protein
MGRGDPQEVALVYDDPVKLSSSVSLAEQAIPARYFEVFVSPISIEETHDLQKIHCRIKVDWAIQCTPEGGCARGAVSVKTCAEAAGS